MGARETWLSGAGKWEAGRGGASLGRGLGRWGGAETWAERSTANERARLRPRPCLPGRLLHSHELRPALRQRKRRAAAVSDPIKRRCPQRAGRILAALAQCPSGQLTDRPAGPPTSRRRRAPASAVAPERPGLRAPAAPGPARPGRPAAPAAPA